METASLVGSLLQTFSPTAVAVAYWVWYAPQQILIVLLGALGCIMSVGLVGAFYAAADATPSAAAGFTYLHLAVQEGVRFVLSFAVYKVEKVFRSKGHSLTSSRIGVASTGMALGVGQGTMQAVLTMGLAASTSASAQFEGIAGYDWTRCPVLPQLEYLSLVGLFTVLIHVSCGIAVLQWLTAFLMGGEASACEGSPLTGPARTIPPGRMGVRKAALLVCALYIGRILFASMPLANQGSYDIKEGVLSGGCEATLPVMGVTALACVCLAVFGVYSDM